MNRCYSISHDVDQCTSIRKNDFYEEDFVFLLLTLIIESVRPVCLTIDSICALSTHGLSLKYLSKNSICSVEKYFSSNRSEKKQVSLFYSFENRKTFDSKTNGMSE